jgi:hypothetical protein
MRAKRHSTQDRGDIALREEFGLDKLIVESRRADSNRLPLLQLRVGLRT